MTAVFEGRRTLFSPILDPLEQLFVVGAHRVFFSLALDAPDEWNHASCSSYRVEIDREDIALDRRRAVWRGAIHVPLTPEIGIVLGHVRTEDVVQIAQPSRLVQVGLGEPGDAQRHRRWGVVHVLEELPVPL